MKTTRLTVVALHTLLAASASVATGCSYGYDLQTNDADTDPDGGVDADASNDADASIDADADGDSDTTVDADLACLDGSTRCSDESLQECVDGVWEVLERCSVGCHGTEPRCSLFMPSNVDHTLLSSASGHVVVSENVDIDTTTCDPAPFGDIRPRAEIVEVDAEVDLCVMIFESLHIEEGTRVRGSGDAPFVVISAGDVVVDGTIDVSARKELPGAGGRRGGDEGEDAPGAGGGGAGTGLDRESSSGQNDSGGGGGGLGGAGGQGGPGGDADSPPRSPGGAGGPIVGYETLVPLHGGGGGGSGSNDPCCGAGGLGGGGGGALQISSASLISVSASGRLLANGGGGAAGGGGGGGGGGGAGGAILVEAPTVVVDGVLSANGGGGGGSENGTDGQNGRAGSTPAAGGEADEADEGVGGAGGAGDIPYGESPEVGHHNGGGGGGAVGRLRINRRGATPGIAGEASPSTAETFTSGHVPTG